MAVIEVGTHQVRCGYVGDSTFSQSMLPCYYQSRRPGCRYSTAELLTDATVVPESLVPLWTSDALEQYPDLHMDQIAYATRVLGETHDPLMLVLPEVWQERVERLSALIGSLLERKICSAVYVARPSVCWALSKALPTAIVVDCGHQHTNATAVCDGYPMRLSTFTAPVGGASVTETLGSLIYLRYGQTLSSAVHPHAPLAIQRAATWMSLTSLKECWSCVAAPKGAKAPAEPATERFVAPDGSAIELRDTARDVATVRECCYEALFRDAPSATSNLQPPSIHVAKLLLRCRRHVDVDLQVASVPHILAGGTALATNFASRMLAELRGLDSAYFKIPSLTTAAPGGAWLGASMAADSSAFAPLWITRKELEEEGSSVIHRKLCY